MKTMHRQPANNLEYGRMFFFVNSTSRNALKKTRVFAEKHRPAFRRALNPKGISGIATHPEVQNPELSALATRKTKAQNSKAKPYRWFVESSGMDSRLILTTPLRIRRYLLHHPLRTALNLKPQSSFHFLFHSPVSA